MCHVTSQENFWVTDHGKVVSINVIMNKRLAQLFILYGMKHTVQEFLLHHDVLGVQIFHIMEKGLFIVQMIKSKADNVCMRGQDN